MAKSTTDRTSETTVNTGGGDYVVGDKVYGDKVEGDKIHYGSEANIQHFFAPIADAIEGATPDRRAEAKAKLDTLKSEASKGKGASDSVLGKLVEDIVALVPGAIKAVVSAFASPILSEIAGPITKSVIDKLRSR